MQQKNNLLLSVIITAHSEGILIHRTLASVRRALDQLPTGSNSEVILHADNPTPATLEYINNHKKTTLANARIFTNHFGDLGSSRNFAVKEAKGKYIATIDADDLMSEAWLAKAIDYLQTCDEPTVAHSEYTIEFEGADSLIIKHGEIDYDTDTLLSVYANRWNSVIVAPREILIENPYTPNSPGYGYEDWNLNCRLIYSRVHNILIPGTAIFVRRKIANSEWARQVQSMAVLRANPLLSFKNIRSVSDPFHKAPIIDSNPASARRQDAVATAKSFIKRSPFAHKVAKQLKRSLQRDRLAIPMGESRIPLWLQDEWKLLHVVERQLYPTDLLLRTIPVYDTLTEDHKLTGSLYKSLIDQMQFDTYEYLLFAPWLTKGGADKYTIEYANTIADITGKNVLVVATLANDSPWNSKLNKSVSFLEFGKITKGASEEIKHRLMEHIVENGKVKVIHVINSEFGYDFIRLHERYIASSDKKVVVTSFSQSVERDTNRLYGYSHTHVPFVYDIANIITSDNESVINMWIKEYGFNADKLVVHRQPIELSSVPNTKRNYEQHDPFRILWAGRIAPEKIPETVIEIGNKLQGKIAIDMYGAYEDGYRVLLHRLPANIVYKGAYDGFNSLNIDQYDALLYTSLFDGMPNVLLEAASAGLPIIASDVGGISELISNGKNGFIVQDIHSPDEYSKAITDLISDPSFGSRLAHANLEKISNDFSRFQYTQNVKAMLTKLGIVG